MFKKLLNALISVLVSGCIITVTTGCNVGYGSTDVSELIHVANEAVRSVSGRGIVLFDRTRNPGNGENDLLDSEKFAFLYTGRYEALPCADRIVSYAVRLPSDMGGCEIHAVECVNPSDCEEIAVYMQMRIRSLRSSEMLSIAPETHEKCFLGAEIFTKGRFVFLLATPDNAAVKKAIEGCFRLL